MTLGLRALFRTASTADRRTRSEAAAPAATPNATVDAENLPRSRREKARLSLIGLFSFGAVSAFGGGLFGAVANGGSVPESYLEGTPFTSYVVPGLILGIVVGGTQLVAALALLRRHGRRHDLAAVAGFGMMIWIFVELAMLRQYSFLQSVYFALGLLEVAIVLLDDRLSSS